jgi:hypothetical protein
MSSCASILSTHRSLQARQELLVCAGGQVIARLALIPPTADYGSGSAAEQPQFCARHSRQPPCRFGSAEPAAQLSVRSVSPIEGGSLWHLLTERMPSTWTLTHSPLGCQKLSRNASSATSDEFLQKPKHYLVPPSSNRRGSARRGMASIHPTITWRRLGISAAYVAIKRMPRVFAGARRQQVACQPGDMARARLGHSSGLVHNHRMAWGGTKATFTG